MTTTADAEVLQLFDEPWEDAVLRLCRKRQELRNSQTPSCEWNKAQREAWRTASRQLQILIENPPS